jgi:glycyl-tRNA synthetase beta chain
MAHDLLQNLLIEIGCEDLPARYVRPLAEALAQGISSGLDARGVERGEFTVFATPRRVAVRIAAVGLQQPEQAVMRKGPAVAAAYKDGAPTRAADGFARSCGVSLDALVEEDGYLVFRKTEPGRNTAELMPAVLSEAINGMDALVPKRMRWGEGDATFVRPVQWLLALHGESVLPLEAFGLRADRLTRGHRFHAPETLALASADDYVEALRAAKVWVDMDSRREAIRDQIEAKAEALGGTARVTEALLEEVTALVEWPVAIAGRIEGRFLQLPAEVIVATVETNQRYFTVFDAEGRLLPAFITVSNIESRDVAQVIGGNERVVRPRLADALFFWEQDRRQPLTDYLPRLDSITFQKALGSTGDKARRVAVLAAGIAAGSDADVALVRRAAELAKADLVTQMVFEFPELQGIMGGHYARAGGEPDAVADAVAEHYQPVGAGTPIPATPVGRIIALADKLDTLAGIFAVGLKPTASKDPYALRRAALGVLRILVEGGLALDLRELLRQALAAQPAGERGEATLHELESFLFDRLRGLLAESVGREVFDAVAACGTQVVTDFVARTEAVLEFQKLPEAEQLAAAHKRVRNILRQAEVTAPAVDPSAFVEAAEGALHQALLAQRDGFEQAVAAADYVNALRQLAALQAPVDGFFSEVMVMADDVRLRQNRLALLAELDRLCREVADISLLPG